MKLDKIQDSREPLQKLTRKECEYVARFNGISDIEPAMPKTLMIQILKANGVRKFRSVTDRGLGFSRARVPPYDEWVRIVTGAQPVPVPASNDVVEVDSVANLRAGWEAEKRRIAVEPVDSLANMKFFALRKVCKARGISYDLTDKKADLLEKLRGQDAA